MTTPEIELLLAGLFLGFCGGMAFSAALAIAATAEEEKEICDTGDGLGEMYLPSVVVLPQPPLTHSWDVCTSCGSSNPSNICGVVRDGEVIPCESAFHLRPVRYSPASNQIVIE